jgi:aspartate aminotransferase
MSRTPIRTLSRRVESIEESATMAITAKAREMTASGIEVIGFGAGEPDFPTPAPIVAAAIAAAADPTTHHYSAVAGLPALRQAVADKTRRDSGIDVSAAQVVITNGAKHAIYSACQVLLDPGDEVLVASPYWVTYPEAIKLAGATPVVVPSGPDGGFLTSVETLEAHRTDKTRAIMFVSPSNPTGAVFPPDLVRAIGEWAVEHDLWVITDEIYEHLVYGAAEFSSMPALVPELADRCVVVNGVAKTYAMTGWRVGWLIGPEAVAEGAARLQSHMTSNVANVPQMAALAAVSGPLDAAEQMRVEFDRRRRTMLAMLNAMPGVDCVEPLGAFYAFPSLNGLIGKTLAGREAHSSIDIADAALTEARIAFVPGEAFGAPGYARFSFALGYDDMVRGLERFADLVAG